MALFPAPPLEGSGGSASTNSIRMLPWDRKMTQWVECHTAQEPESDLWHP